MDIPREMFFRPVSEERYDIYEFGQIYDDYGKSRKLIKEFVGYYNCLTYEQLHNYLITTENAYFSYNNKYFIDKNLLFELIEYDRYKSVYYFRLVMVDDTQ